MWYEPRPYGGQNTEYVDQELLRLRDEDGTNLRLIVRPREDGEPGALLIVLATDEDWLKFELDDWDVASVVDALRATIGQPPLGHPE